jgi:UPF0755 protein
MAFCPLPYPDNPMRKLIAIALIVLAAGAAAGYAMLRQFSAPGPLEESRDVVVPRGSLEVVANALHRESVISVPFLFRAAALATWDDGPLRAGELHFPKEASVETVLAVLRFGRPVQHRLTIPEGLTAAQIAKLFAAESLLGGELSLPPEGALLPDTYSFERDTPVNSVMSRARLTMAHALAAAWAARAPGLALRSPREALILASIVEREARLTEERPMIARVFLNRLAAGMRLQADPTASYAASGGLGTLDRPLDHDDLEHLDPYNTYVVDGLPAGPICSPGLASIQAVLHPSSGPALYFVTDGTGGHVFSNSLPEHNSNVSRMRARGRR